MPSPGTTLPPSEPCEICEVWPAVVGDGPVLRCRACIYQMTDWVARPELLSNGLAKGLSILHGDLVELVTEIDIKMVATPFGIFGQHVGSHLTWRFNVENFEPGRIPPYGRGGSLSSAG